MTPPRPSYDPPNSNPSPSPPLQTPSGNENGDDDESSDYEDDPTHDFKVVEQLPVKVFDANAIGKIYQPSPEELTAIDGVKYLRLTGTIASVFDDWVRLVRCKM